MTSRRLSELYVILDPSVSGEDALATVLREAAKAGARLFQYRNKTDAMNAAYAAALPLRRLAADVGATFIVNDRCDLALAVEADGVHLGQSDLPYAEARRVMGPGKLIGLSTHTAEQVREAERLQPDYIGFGPIFKPLSKKDHDAVVGVEGLRLARGLTRLPIYAIGGIQQDHVARVLDAGADGIAVISAVANAPDIQRAARELLGLTQAGGRRAFG